LLADRTNGVAPVSRLSVCLTDMSVTYVLWLNGAS